LLYRRDFVRFDRYQRLARHRALMPIWAFLIAVVVLLPGLSSPGLWEPQEMRIADDAAERADRTIAKAAAEGRDKPPVAAPPTDCPKAATDDDGARSLTPELAATGLTALGSDEGDMRLLLALLGLLTVLAVYGTGARLASPRAGLAAAVVLLSFPMLVLQARQLTSELGTAAGAALIVYGLVAAARPARWPWALPDLITASLAIGLGTAIAFLGGGVFLGVLPPLGAVALAGGLGVAFAAASLRVARQLSVRVLARVSPRHAVGREEPVRTAARIPARDAAIAAVSLLALVGALGAVYVLFDQIYDVQQRAPGTREVFGKSLLTTECWSDALGGLWRSHDDVRSTYDSMFEQIAFGMFPWSVLAPVALLALALGHGGEERRYAGRLALAWAALAWLTATVFERKVGFTVYAGFPACALAIGVWIDGFLESREAGSNESRAAGLLVGLWVLLGMITVAKDLQAFPEKMTSLLVGSEQIKYPVAKLLGLHLRTWLLPVAVLTGLAFALGVWLWRPAGEPQHKVARWIGRWGVHVALVLAAITGVFWSQVWQRTLSRSLSSKHVFSVYRDLRADGDLLGIMGDMGNAPRYYADGEWEKIQGREGLLAFLGKEQRVFALAPASELCAIHRAFAGKPYYVLDDSNAKFLLLSNDVTGARDRNPLSTTILREKPEGIEHEFSATFDDKIELIGYTVPRKVSLRSRFTMTLYFRVKKAVSGSWKIFAHFDGKGLRFQGDHEPIRGRCATSFWQEGDYIVDTFSVEAGDITFEPGNYQIRVGFFTGTNPNWKNMKVTAAPPGAKDDADRVLLGTIQVD
jgi:hypothetical protein